MSDAEHDLRQLMSLAYQAIAASFTGNYEAAARAHNEHYRLVCERCLNPTYRTAHREALGRINEPR